MDESRTATDRRWIGRVLQLSAVLLAGFAGAVVGVLVPYLDLSEGPFVDGETEFEQVDWDPSDCYWSPEAAEVDARLAQSFVAVPVVATVLVAIGFALAAWRTKRVGFATPVDWGSAVVDVLLACGAIAGVSGVAVSTAYGFAIDRLLDPGCVRAAVPGPRLTLVVHLLGAVVAVAAGVWLEVQRKGRRG